MGHAVARNPSKADRLAQAMEAFRLRQNGVPDYEVCQQLGISMSTLRRRIRMALDHRLSPYVDDYRAEMTERIGMYRYRLLEELGRTVEGADGQRHPVAGPADVASLVGRLLGCEERLAKLHGLDAPTRLTVESQVDAELRALAEELGKMGQPQDRARAEA